MTPQHHKYGCTAGDDALSAWTGRAGDLMLTCTACGWASTASPELLQARPELAMPVPAHRPVEDLAIPRPPLARSGWPTHKHRRRMSRTRARKRARDAHRGDAA